MAERTPEYVTLVSNDGFEFVVRKSATKSSATIQRMLEPGNGFVESETQTCRFEEINGITLEKVCEYFYYAEKNEDAKDIQDMDIPIELVLLLLEANEYLHMEG